MMTMLITTILNAKSKKKLTYDWNFIGSHPLEWSDEYAYEDAQALLQLSLMTTAANSRDVSLGTPSWLQDTEVFYGVCPIPLLAEKTPPALLAHVLYSPTSNIVFMVFTGTSNICMASLDLDYTQVEVEKLYNYEPGMKAHRGFYNAYVSVRDQLWNILDKYEKTPKIFITGHSLGGGLSQLCALDFAQYNPIHYSFASPSVFNEKACGKFANVVSKSYRVANISDIVTSSPLAIMPNGDKFYHVGVLAAFQRNMDSLSENHSLAYVTEYNIPYILS